MRRVLATALLLLAGSADAGQRFDVREYGARGDGVADDGPAIRTAIDALVAASGGELYFPPGVYLVASRSPQFGGWAALQMVFTGPNTEPIRIVGENATLRHQAGEGRALFSVGAHLPGRPWEQERWPVRDVLVSGLTFEGTRRPTDRDIEATQGNTLLHLTWVEDVRVTGCRFARSNGAGLYFFARRASFERNVFDDANGGLQGNMSREVRVSSNTFRCTAKCDDQLGIFGGAGAAASMDIRFTGNVVEKGWDGKGRLGGTRRGWARSLVVGGNTHDVEVRGNVFADLGSVLAADVNAPAALSGLVLEAGRGGAPRNVRVEGNLFRNLWGHGVVAVGVQLDGLAVRGNAFRGLGGGGVVILGPPDRGRHRAMVVEGNAFWAVDGIGSRAVIQVDAADDVAIVGNRFSDCGGEALVEIGRATAHAEVTGNHVGVAAGAARGALFRLEGVADAVVAGNRFTASGRALFSAGAADSRIEARDNVGP